MKRLPFAAAILCVLLCFVNVRTLRADPLEEAVESYRNNSGLLCDRQAGEMFTRTLALDMIYQAQCGRREAYEKLEKFLLGAFRSPLGLVYHSLDKAFQPMGQESWLADNMTACRALAEGYGRWGGQERKAATLSIGRSVLKYLRHRGKFAQSVSWRDPIWGVHLIDRGAEAPLFLLDVAVMDRLSRWDEAWKQQAQKSLGELAAGCVVPWQDEKTPQNGREYLLPLVYLTEMGFLPLRGLEEFRLRLREWPYALVEGAEPSVGIGALCAVLYCMAGSEQQAGALLDAMTRRFSSGRVTSGLLAGAGQKPSLDDNLLFLIARAQVQTRSRRGGNAASGQ
ncbi:hypothetical protein JonanDRAFT_0482 [Jonquetella anthropi DSM 22815]|uniref:Uncharacterized protein n=1 Tax=Jonquetella anthropi DSM 22815 TaxID=885272 RepID=H0UJM0_9BACT|nr:hypothetical protein [Jonquetella anthropi]EEX48874.1 hypothetical protein GCWU000246_00598 [Jonquetella anthropi E3_33 E1]EHM12888.1 hypothetical protein JonanDRAFT_0482 [Jonquetella anthropi DSM 22815]